MKYVAVFILSMVFWLLLTFSLTVPNLVTGSVASALCSALFARNYFTGIYKFLQPVRYFWLMVYLAVFTVECIKANLDVAYRVLHPSMPIKPGIVKLKTTLKSEFARTLLANSITMTPGTITVDIIDDCLYIHWIYVSSEDPEEYTRIITGAFEKYIKRFAE
ncbi:MAG TPA: Na+/H+ antiporter subunit E [Bacteroidales bacterium]|jgi:multicomponent Na+:H+ antiporter subunit E|nr:Na+/H+ antiporter subunit E [Bacteroidales bacterium]